MAYRKHILSLLLAIQPYLTYCRVSDDSLKKQVALSPFMKYEEAYRGKGEQLALETIKELFKDHFHNVKIYLALYRRQCGPMHGLAYFPKLCTIDVNTGKPVHFRDAAAFYRFINSADKEISNLDKAYLYLFLFRNVLDTEHMITDPGQYRPELAGNSAFRGNDADKLFIDKNCLGCALLFSSVPGDQMKKDILNSTDASIIMYAEDFGQPAASNYFTRYRYRFTFDKDNLSGVKADSFVVK